MNIHGSEIYNQQQVDAFYKDALAGIPAFMRVMQYTIEGDAVITDYQYDGKVYTVTDDSTRDKFSSPDDRIITTAAYKYLVPLDRSHPVSVSEPYYLSNEQNIFIGTADGEGAALIDGLVWIPSPSDKYDIIYPTGPYGEFWEYRTEFTSSTEGWFIGSTDVAMGRQETYVYLTHDGGNTWQETGNVNDKWSKVLTCGGFANDKVGFLCFRYDIENMGRIYRTVDGGKTWELLDIPVLTELVGNGIGEVRQINFGNGKAHSSVNITYFASKTDVDAGMSYYISSIGDPDKWNVEDWYLLVE